jgi:hypothetical protein
LRRELFEVLKGETMEKLSIWFRNGLALLGLLALGYWLGSAHTVRASSYGFDAGDMQFQLGEVNQSSSLLVSQPGTRTVFVYQGATTGNSELHCSFKFQLARPGEPIHRTACALQ